MPEQITLSKIYIYPVKSAGGVCLEQAQIEKRGLRHDRRWMVVDGQGKQVTGREQPALSCVAVELLECGLRLRACGMPTLDVPLHPQGEARRVQIWDDQLSSLSVSGECRAWFSSHLGGDFDLVYMPDTAERWQSGLGKPYRRLLSFADGNPFHLISEASVALLNTQLAQPVAVERFRPNLVVSGSAPYAEDLWRHITLDGVGFQVVESCHRCSVINLLPGGRPGAEPLRTLARLRRQGHKVPFGQHLILDTWLPETSLRVGSLLRIDTLANVPNPMY